MEWGKEMNSQKRFRYLFLMRPPMPGAFPRDGLKEIGFDEGKTLSGHHYWGWAEYDRELTKNEVFAYELEREKRQEQV